MQRIAQVGRPGLPGWLQPQEASATTQTNQKQLAPRNSQPATHYATPITPSDAKLTDPKPANTMFFPGKPKSEDAKPMSFAIKNRLSKNDAKCKTDANAQRSLWP